MIFVMIFACLFALKICNDICNDICLLVLLVCLEDLQDLRVEKKEEFRVKNKLETGIFLYLSALKIYELRERKKKHRAR